MKRNLLHQKYRSLGNTTTGSWCFRSLSAEEIRNKSPVLSSNVMYCFHVSSQCLLFWEYNLLIRHFEMLKVNYSLQKQF